MPLTVGRGEARLQLLAQAHHEVAHAAHGTASAGRLAVRPGAGSLRHIACSRASGPTVSRVPSSAAPDGGEVLRADAVLGGQRRPASRRGWPSAARCLKRQAAWK